MSRAAGQLVFGAGDRLTLHHELTGFTLALVLEPRANNTYLLAQIQNPYLRLHASLYKDSVSWKPTSGNAQAGWTVEALPEQRLQLRCKERCLQIDNDGRLSAGEEAADSSIWRLRGAAVEPLVSVEHASAAHQLEHDGYCVISGVVPQRKVSY